MVYIKNFDEFFERAKYSDTVVNPSMPDIIELPSDRMTPDELDRHLLGKYGMRLVHADDIPDPADVQPGYAEGNAGEAIV